MLPLNTGEPPTSWSIVIRDAAVIIRNLIHLKQRFVAVDEKPEIPQGQAPF